MNPDMAGTWDAEAARFDEEPDHGLLDAAVRDAWADLLREYVPARSTVLDLGCGTGSLAVLLAEQGHVVTGVDLSPRMLEAAQDKAVRHSTDVTFVLGDASEPPVAGPFDVVLARHVVWALPDPSGALDRWAAVLASHGRLVLIEGLWGNGAGMSAIALHALVQPKVDRLEVRHLPEEALWGRQISDERYVLTAHV
jgi:ubiquinone/menaquinone biosynthesis C-methylase UbiE